MSVGSCCLCLLYSCGKRGRSKSEMTRHVVNVLVLVLVSGDTPSPAESNSLVAQGGPDRQLRTPSGKESWFQRWRSTDQRRNQMPARDRRRDFRLNGKSMKSSIVPARNAAERVVGSVDHVTGTVCGDGYCVCGAGKANCSRHGGRLTYVPWFPPDIYSLDFSQNALAAIPNDEFFSNATHLTDISLKSNGLRTISPGAFRLLPELYSLDLGNNQLTYGDLAAVLYVHTLLSLDIGNNNLGPLPERLFQEYDLPHLQNLELTGNRLESVSMSAFSQLPSLTVLELGLNKLSEGSFSGDASLNILDLSLSLDDNAFYSFIETCINDTSLFPFLTDLSMMYNNIQYLPRKVCLPNLRSLTLGGNPILVFPSDTFSPQMFPSLTALILDDTRDTEKLEKFAFRNPNLTWLNLQNNQWKFARIGDPDSFAGLDNVFFLALDGNEFYSVTEEKFVELFRHLLNLQYLAMDSCQVSHVTSGMFSIFQHLKAISLQGNKLTVLPDGVFDGLQHLTELYLFYNQIALLSEATFGTETRRRLEVLDLRYNPFDCTCGLLWFHRWLKENPALLQHENDVDYTCSNLPNTTVQAFYLPDQACLLQPYVSIFLTASITVLLCGFLTITTLYHYRWHLRLLLYQAVRGNGERQRQLQQQHFDYDVFVSYDSEDLHWVLQHLIPELEQGLGLRLCLHERDFIPGKHIVENISDSVESSKKVMMLFSPSFVTSPWCQFELNFCLRHSLELDDALLIVFLEDIAPRDLTPAMMAVMKTTTYIEWQDGADARAAFWGRIHVALGEILPAVGRGD